MVVFESVAFDGGVTQVGLLTVGGVVDEVLVIGRAAGLAAAGLTAETADSTMLCVNKTEVIIATMIATAMLNPIQKSGCCGWVCTFAIGISWLGWWTAAGVQQNR
jgi:hypothetical protein